MAKLCTPIHSPGPVNAGEKHLFDFLQVNLPDSYYIIPNGCLLYTSDAADE